MDRGAWWATVQGVANMTDQLSAYTRKNQPYGPGTETEAWTNRRELRASEVNPHRQGQLGFDIRAKNSQVGKDNSQ